MANDINDFEDFGATDDVIKTGTGETQKPKGKIANKGNDDSEGDAEGKDAEGDSKETEAKDGDSETEKGKEEGDTEESGEKKEEETEGEPDSQSPEKDEDVETKKPEGYSEDKESDSDGDDQKDNDESGNEKKDDSKQNNKDKKKDPNEGNVCLGLNALREDENSLGVLKTKKDGLYIVRFPETNEIKELERSNVVFANDYVSFYIGGRIELGYITAFNIIGRTCNIINWKSNEKWNDVDVNDIISLASEDEIPESEKAEDDKDDSKEDEASQEQKNLEQENLKRFKSLQFFVKFFLDEKKAKDYRKFIRYYKFGEWKAFHHQSFWLLNEKIVNALDLLSVFNEENGDDLAQFISIDNSAMLNINMLGLKNQEILKELSDIKNIPNVFYRIVNEKTSLKDFYCNYTSDINERLNYNINFAYFGRKIFVFSERVHEQERSLNNFFVLNVDKSNKRIYGKIKNSESDKYIFNVYYSNFEKISYYEIFSYICFVLIWKSKNPNQITDYSEIENFVKRYLTTAKQILI